MNSKSSVSFLLLAALLIVGCSLGRSADASCNLDAKDLPKLLEAVSSVIETGFGDREIQAIRDLAASTALKGTGTRTFPIAYRGKSARLRVELKKDDVDEIEIWFFTEPELTREIQSKMREIMR